MGLRDARVCGADMAMRCGYDGTMRLRGISGAAMAVLAMRLWRRVAAFWRSESGRAQKAGGKPRWIRPRHSRIQIKRPLQAICTRTRTLAFA